jgi:hypothetical protein
MGFYFVEPDLLPGETVRYTYAANRANSWRSIGGRLSVTDKRMVFRPHRVDALFHAQPWSCRLQDVASVNVAAKQLNAKEMGVRNRLQITLQDGHQEKFLVRDLDQVIVDLQAHINLQSE